MPSAVSTQSNHHQTIDGLLQNIDNLPSIPETLMEILKVLDDPDSGASDLAEVVRLDAPLMSKILRLANSPYYSQRGGLTDINRCLSLLGYRTVRQVAVCVTVATSVVSAAAKNPGQLDYRELWRHSVVTGAVAKQLASVVGYLDPEEIFTAGLLHDLGKFVLELHSATEYDLVMARRRESGMSLSAEEERQFGFDHAAVGQAFGNSWRFPELLSQCFGHHHDQMIGSPHNPQEQAVALVALADYLAHTLEPARCDLGFDPNQVDSLQLHRNADLDVRLVESNLSAIKESIKLAGAYLDL